ncbi:tryptophan--tRNA ligase [Candidatus Pacearchaeota archaeon]|nr:tryptophan--tRNA ligase [Candidatus Pacearchaeota archaeon]
MASRILSGMRPTGKIHIGHMVGAIDNWIELQKKYECFYFVADWHAMTTETDTSGIKQNTVEMVKDWLSAGVNPEKSVIFIQSLVPQHAELHMVLSMLNTLPRLERLPTYKGHLKQVLEITDPKIEPTEEQIDRARSKISYGFVGYPVLMAADILAYRADGVPVGEDQDPHLELAREIADRFNRLYGNVFPIPESLHTITPRILGTDGRKMSKSLGNAIHPTDTLEVMSAGVRKMLTDPQRSRREIGGNPNVCSVYDLHMAYTSEERNLEIHQACNTAQIGCTECKREAAAQMAKKYEGYAERRAVWDGRERQIIEILMEGSRKAREIAGATLQQVREHLLIDYENITA